MSCQTILDVLSDKPITSAEIENITNYKRSYISACLARYVKAGKVTKIKVESTNKLGPRMIYVFTLAPVQQ
jgi:predicted transcriptional regulator